jgi:hypothetical protein
MYVICMVGPGWAALIEYISVLSRSTIFVCMYACMRILKKRVQQTFLFGDWKGDGLFSNAESVISFRNGKCDFAAVSLF